MAGVIIEGHLAYCDVCGADAVGRPGRWELACCGTQKQEANVDVVVQPVDIFRYSTKEEHMELREPQAILAWLHEHSQHLTVKAAVKATKKLKLLYAYDVKDQAERKLYGQCLYLLQQRLKGTGVNFAQVQ